MMEGIFEVAFEYVITRGIRLRGSFGLYFRRLLLGICLARSIYFVTREVSYCRFSRWDWSADMWCCSVSGVEQIRRMRRAWLYGMLLIVCGG